MYKEGRTKYSRADISVLIVSSILIFSSLSISLSAIGSDIKEKTDTRGYSLDGEYTADEAASVILLGEDQEERGGRLGSFMGKADVNGDGLDDLYVSAPYLEGVPGTLDTGKCYIWYGGNDPGQGEVDLSTASPDITIRGSSMNSQTAGTVTAGDINGDGYTDIVLGNPKQPDSGKIYVLWGDSDGWPSTIDLFPVAGNQPNANPVGFLRTEDYAIIGGYETTSTLGTDLGRDIEIADLDNDNYDDLVFSFHGWNAVFIGWGGPDKMSFGNDFTYMKEMTEVSRYGFDIELGDIDGDEVTDMIVTAPVIEDESRSVTRSGAVYVYYGIGRIRGNSSVPPTTYLRPRIDGEDSYDFLGTNTLLKDIDGDGKDDLIIGAPGADGIQNNLLDSGAIYVIKGDNITSFPNEAVIDDVADITVHGQYEKNGVIPGSEIGRDFDIGDTDGDGKLELVTTTPTAIKNDITGAGRCDLYGHQTIFESPEGVVDLSTMESRMTLWGSDQEDSLGSGVTMIDLLDDGTDELVVSSSAADGTSNLRTASGETYVIEGNPISVRDLEVSGSGTREDFILSGSGSVELKLQVSMVPSLDLVKDIEITIDPEAKNLTFVWSEGQPVSVLNDPYGTVNIDTGGSGWEEIGRWGFLTIAFSTSLLFDIPDKSDLRAVVRGEEGSVSERLFDGFLSVSRDLRLKGNPIIERNGMPTPSVNSWFTTGDIIGISGPRIEYLDHSGTEYTGDSVSMELRSDSTRPMTTEYTEDWSFEAPVDPSNSSFVLSIIMNEGAVPGGFPQESLPDLGEGIMITLHIDDTNPEHPTMVTSYPDGERASDYDDDNRRIIRLNETVGNTLDVGGSGVKKFQYSTNGTAWTDVMEEGGLWATYYIGRNFDQAVHTIEELDITLDHPITEWNGFSPHSSQIPAEAFSIRYHGWFRAEESREHRFSLSGGGEAKLILGNRTLIDWSHLEPGIIAPEVFLKEGEIIEIALYMKSTLQETQGTRYSGISLKLENDVGDMVPLESTQMLYPSNGSLISVPEGELFDIMIRSVDWVDLQSDLISRRGYTDNEGPRFDLSTIERWYPDSRPTIRFGIGDPGIGNVSGSGIDLENVHYRTRPRNSDEFSEWIPVDIFEHIMEGEDGPVSVDALFEVELGNDWQGVMQFEARDIVGNDETSSLVDIGVDRSGPSFEIIEPSIIQTQDEGEIDILVKVVDRPGAGVDGSSIEFRFRPEGQEYTAWQLMNGSGVSEEVFASYTVDLPSGNYDLQFRATDNVGNTAISEPFLLSLAEVVEDNKPVPVISSPVEGQQFREGMPVLLDSEGTYDDGEGRYSSLVYTWFSNRSGYLGSGESLSVYLSELGMHRITLFVDDGSLNHNVSTMVNITMVPLDVNGTPSGDPNATEDDDQTFEVLLISSLVVIALALLLIFLVLRYKKRREDEIQIHYRERTDDEESYERMIEEEEIAMGLTSGGNVQDEDLDEQRRNLYGEDEY